MPTVIESLTIRNLKGATGTFALTQLHYTHGRNRSGKTTVRDALQLVITGQHPTAGLGGRAAKKTVDVFHLANGDVLQVAAGVRNDRGRSTISRTWRQTYDAKGRLTHPKCKATATIAGKAIQSSYAAGAIEELLGDLRFVDVTELLRAGEKKRRDMIFDFVGQASWDHDELWQHAEAAGLTLEMMQAIWAGKVAQADARGARLCRNWDGSYDLNAWLKAQAEFMADIHKKEHASLVRLRKSIELYNSQGHPEFDQAIREAARVALAEAEQRAKTTAVDWAEKVRQANVALVEEKKLANEIRMAEIQLSKAQTELKELEAVDLTAEIKALQAKADEQYHKGEGLEADAERLRAELDAQNRKIAALEQQIAAAEKERVDLAASVERGTVWLRDLEVDLSRTTTEIETKLRTLKEAIRTLESGFCPTCNQTVDQSVVQALWSQADEASAKLASETDLASRKRRKGGAKHERNQQDLRDMDEQMRSIRNSIAFLRHSGIDRKIAEAQRAANAARSNARLFEGKIKDAQSASPNWQRDVDALRQRIAELTELSQRQTNVMGLEFDLSTVGNQRRAAEQQATDAVAAARAKLDEIAREVDALRTHRRNEAAAIAAEEDWRAAKHAAKVIGNLQAQLLKAALAPMVDPVNRCIDGLGIGTFEMRDTDDQGQDGLWLGLRHDDGAWSHIETMSGAEYAIVSGAVLIGLAHMGAAPWKPLFLEADNLDDDLLRRFMLKSAQLVAEGVVDQVFIAGCHAIPKVEDEWTVLEMGGAA